MPKKPSDIMQTAGLNSQIAQPKKLLDIASSVLSQIHFVGNRIQHTGSASYRKWFGIGISEYRLLGVIGNEPGSTGARISEVMGLDIAAISRTLNKMKKKNLVLYTAHPRHPSYKCWYVTEQGAELHDRVQEMTKLREETLLIGFTEAETFQLLSFLHRLSENASGLQNIAEQGEAANAK